ncbi:gp55, partial [Burkholderia pseudomallei 1710a]
HPRNPTTPRGRLNWKRPWTFSRLRLKLRS